MNNQSFSLLFVVTFLGFASFLPAQGLGQMSPLDDAFLASLPDGLRQQMLGQAEEPDEESDYSNPDTRKEKFSQLIFDKYPLACYII